MHLILTSAVVALIPLAFAGPKVATPISPTSTCTQTLCADYINSCGQTYGGCYPACKGYPTPSFTDPGCPTTTPKPTTVSTKSCGFLCKDYFDACGNTYGPGCFTSCPGQADPTFTTPICVTTTTTKKTTTTTKKPTKPTKPTKKPGKGCTSSSCQFLCQDYFDDCGNTYGPGCYTSCPGQAPPKFTTPYCPVTGSMTIMAPKSTKA